jgi:2-iminobutanoate/2-iminopropanoate deaminase
MGRNGGRGAGPLTRRAFATRASTLPLSPAVELGSIVAVSGMVALDRVTRAVVGQTVAEQTAQALRNVQAALEEAGLGMDDVFKTTVFLTRGGDFDEMNRAYASFFREPYPARSTIVVALVRPDLLVEIEALAWRAKPEG